ncbi:MAG: PEGA domain-containing protein [Alistipes sp.]|nr:PEGA domain-containing protein [Alistipes sp.]
MKKIFTILLSLLICATATAQVENSIVIDIASLRAVQQDALTGVNIDPIGVDHSRQACARVKIKFDRMNRQQIDALVVKMRSNTDLTKQKVADYYDNVLILEMTAKPNTRFYFVSPEFGESNEVTLNLEGNREYELEAALNQTFSIIVNSNVSGADIYIDDIYKGQTGSSNTLTVKDVMIGAHTLKVKYGKMEYSQAIEVNSGSIAFRQNVDTQASKPQFVVFAVEPTNAVVTINGTLYTLQDGAMQIVLESGTYNYTVSASGYHSQSGSFTVAGSKVEKIITLTADVATVTITTPDNAEIWVNNIQKGSGRWSGTLSAGTYIIEARKAGYRSTSITRQISSKEQNQSYTLPAPTPIYGSLLVSGTPIMAEVVLDGNTVGRTPLELNTILEGNHTLVVSKSGYSPQSQTVNIVEGKTTTVNISLTKLTSATASTPVSSGQSYSANGAYKVGDYYNDGTKEGVVFEVSADGRSGKIVSMTHSGDNNMPWAVGAEQKKTVGATDKYDGRKNMEAVRKVSGWRTLYPGFAWCANLGPDWYLPAIEELKIFTLNENVYNAVNATLQQHNGTPLLRRGGEYSGGAWYWSSTESGVWDKTLKQYEAWHVALKSMKEFAGYKSYPYRNVRAIARFECGNTAAPIYTPSAQTSKVYKVGDYYNDGVKQGIVFEVSADGRSGKIISENCSPDLMWAVGSEQSKFIGATDQYDGQKNMDVVKRISGWQSKYPAFNWCAELGNGWYLPAKEEWTKIYSLRSKLEPKLSRKLDIYFWSSTEANEMYKGQYCAWNIAAGTHTSFCKSRTNKFFAVAKFGVGTSVSYAQPSSSAKTYHIGDYYNDGVKQGVVFAVENGGRNGKIVSLKHAKGLYWTNDSTEQKRSIGAKNSTDGAANMDAVKRISGWQSKYPAFKWCANLGADWYLPAKDELQSLISVSATINKTLTAKGGDKIYQNGDLEYYLSSTEYSSDPSWVYIYRFMINSIARSTKDNNNNTTIRAIAKF